jgi:hypothetical protein
MMDKKLLKIAPFQHFRGTFDSSVFCVRITGNVLTIPGQVGIFPPRGLTTVNRPKGRKSHEKTSLGPLPLQHCKIYRCLNVKLNS